MHAGRRHRPPGGGDSPGASAGGRSAGKRTLVEQVYPVQLKAAASPPSAQGTDANGVAHDADAAVAGAASSSGAPVDPAVRGPFESSLGVDLSAVRVHTGPSSADAASSLGARAYTTGHDIHFAAGAYDPASQDGRHLLAHEVAHTVQQRGGAAVQRKLDVSAPGDAAEHEADRAADAMTSGRPFTIQAAGGAAVGRVHRDYYAEMAALDAAKTTANKSMAQSDWYMVGRRLNGFSNDDITSYVSKRMSVGERSHTLSAATAVAPELDRVVLSIKAVDKEAGRIADVYRGWDLAVAKPDWERAANLLNAMGESDQQRRLRPLTWAQKMDLQAASRGNARVASAIEKSEKERVATVVSAYITAIAGGDWVRGANQLHGMDDAGIETRLKDLLFTQLMAIRNVATPRIIAACDKDLARRRSEDKPDALGTDETQEGGVPKVV